MVMKEDLWKEFASEVKKGWKVDHSEAMDGGYGVERTGTVLSVNRNVELCPHCKGELEWHYKVDILWRPYDERGKPSSCPEYYGWMNPLRRSVRGWVTGSTTSHTFFDPPN
jgi:hypothetical protein